MRKGVLLFAFVLVNLFVLKAQDEKKDFESQLDIMSQQMEKMFEGMQGPLSESQILIDTFFQYSMDDFDFDGGNFHFDSGNMDQSFNQLFEMMQRSLQSFSDQDWSELREFGKEFEMQIPNDDELKKLQEQGLEDRPKALPKKKERKTYKL